MPRIVNTIEFPLPVGGFVYTFYFGDTPFYVGEADCFQTRMTDYQRKSFGSSTDFNVGEAAAYFVAKGYPVTVRFWASDDRYTEETETVDQLKTQGYELLNGKLHHDYRGSKDTRPERVDQQRAKVHEFCYSLIELQSKRLTKRTG